MAIVRAVALVSQTIGTDSVLSNYNVSFVIGVSDGVADLQTGGFAQIPFAIKPTKRDDALRKIMADKIQMDFGLIIDPDDIYIPFSRD